MCSTDHSFTHGAAAQAQQVLTGTRTRCHKRVDTRRDEAVRCRVLTRVHRCLWTGCRGRGMGRVRATPGHTRTSLSWRCSMYKNFYGFRTYPFDPTADAQFLYPSDTYQDCLSCLLHGLQRGYGILVMTGAIGTGKTFLLHTLLQHLDATTHTAFVNSSTFNALEILQYAVQEFRLDFSGDSKAQLLIQLRNFLVTQTTSNAKVVLIVDEAHTLSVEALEDLRLLTNFESAQKKLIQMILVGHFPLEETLKCPELLQLRQRVGRCCRLRPLNDDETQAYIAHRLAVAGATEPLFTPQAIEAVYRHAQGIPRVINTICDGALW